MAIRDSVVIRWKRKPAWGEKKCLRVSPYTEKIGNSQEMEIKERIDTTKPVVWIYRNRVRFWIPRWIPHRLYAPTSFARRIQNFGSFQQCFSFFIILCPTGSLEAGAGFYQINSWHPKELSITLSHFKRSFSPVSVNCFPSSPASISKSKNPGLWGATAAWVIAILSTSLTKRKKRKNSIALLIIPLRFHPPKNELQYNFIQQCCNCNSFD